MLTNPDGSKMLNKKQ
jgi:hypothetical protein